MRFVDADLEGAFVIEPEEAVDSRGFFARLWCERELAAAGLVTRIAQMSMSYNQLAGTVRGMHFQHPPHAETKIVRCTRGAIYDVIVDLRSTSLTYLQWRGFELTSGNRRALYVPPGFAHGFQSLEDHSEVFYQISEFHSPDAADGLRYDDPALRINWPLAVSAISDRDRSWKDLSTPRRSTHA